MQTPGSVRARQTFQETVWNLHGECASPMSRAQPGLPQLPVNRLIDHHSLGAPQRG